MTSLPLIIVNFQRGAPETGQPTKTEQSDLMLAIHGRSGECPMPVIAASTPSDCFDYAYIAAKLTLEHMTPVILLTDGYIANGSEPWKIKSIKEMPPIKTKVVDKKSENWHPYDRDNDTLSRNWAIPGTAGLEHRVGGLEKDKITGNVSYVTDNHEYMTNIRAEKVKSVENYIPKLEEEYQEEGDLLVIGRGGTYGRWHSVVRKLVDKGFPNKHFRGPRATKHNVNKTRRTDRVTVPLRYDGKKS